jgi:hypothetical protein
MVSKVLAAAAIVVTAVGAFGLVPFVPAIAVGVVCVAVAILV